DEIMLVTMGASRAVHARTVELIAELPRSLFGRASPDSGASIQSVVMAPAAKFELSTVISVECTATRMMAKRFDGSVHPTCASPAWICRTPDSSLHLRPLRLAGSASVRISGARLGRPQISPHLLIGRRRAEAADHRHRSWILWQGRTTRRAFAPTCGQAVRAAPRGPYRCPPRSRTACV